VQLLPQRTVLHGKHKLGLIPLLHVSEVKKKEQGSLKPAPSIVKVLRLQELRREQQDVLRVKSNVLELGKLVARHGLQGELRAPKRVRQGELRAKNSVPESGTLVAKLEQLTCSERCSGAIKRTGITSRLSASIEHD
jgi:hypothetical protein